MRSLSKNGSGSTEACCAADFVNGSDVNGLGTDVSATKRCTGKLYRLTTVGIVSHQSDEVAVEAESSKGVSWVESQRVSK